MTELRHNEFIDLLEMEEILFEDKGKLIQTSLPDIGTVTYYPKSDRLQITKSNSWKDGGFSFVKSILSSEARKYSEKQLIGYAIFYKRTGKSPKEYFVH